MKTNFIHKQSAHCENGVTTNLLQYHGLDFINEPLTFGIGSGLFYIHIPFVELSGGPFISFRTIPGQVFKRTCKALNVEITRKRFKDKAEAHAFVEQKVAEGVPIGCQVGVFNLPYFPKEYRFHFNAHNLVIYGKENGKYLISDPVMETTTVLSPEDLERVRFAKGAMAPKGHVYFPENVKPVSEEHIRKAIIKGIKRNTRDMLRVPGNIAGVKGIKYTAKKIRKLQEKLGQKKAGLYLGQIIRMQEEIGTGGGGFRYIYASFLEQTSEILNNDKFLNISDDFTKAGDMWRNSAIQMAGIFKNRLTEQKDYEQVADMLIEISEQEKMAFQKIAKLKLK